MARPTNADSNATRRRLLDAATVAFSRGGLDGTTLRAVRHEMLMAAAPDSSYDETLHGREALAAASLTGEMRRIKRDEDG